MLNTPNPIVDQFKTSLIEHGFSGDFHIDYSTRLVNATDNSIYELLPEAVIQPRHIDDVQSLMRVANYPQFKALVFTARGGGTGTNGQALSDAMVIDFSRYMQRILHFDLQAQTITVEPGIILSDLNQFLKAHGLFFAPNVSTADRATIGGMIATDAAGKGSLIYGKTSDHLISLKLILADGRLLESKELSISKLAEADTEYSFIKEIIALLDNDAIQDEIKRRFPRLKRQLSGYNIQQCYKDGQFNLSRLIAGSEGTLGLVVAATLKLLPIPRYRALVVVHYNSFIEALKAARELINHQPLAIETVDEKVQKSAQTLPNWPILAKLLNSAGKNYISNFVEFVDDDNTSLIHSVTRLTNDLDKNNANYVVINDANQINQLWSIRSLAVGLAGKIPGDKKPVAFVEDAIVPPEYLADFVIELQQILDSCQLNYAMYGHVDVGCLHVRPALNMQDNKEREKIRPLTEEIIRLLDKYHGILWGEHGKGFRGEFVPHVFGAALYAILCQIKSLFDPHNRFNPGKLTVPYRSNQQLFKIDQVPMRGELDQMIDKNKQIQFSAAMLCNGNGACFNHELSNVMCPSYKVTGDRIHSPKGRAMLVKEWLRKLSLADSSDGVVADLVMKAMNGCLGCKGCSGKCPTQVSIPDLRSTFLFHYHKAYKRRNLNQLLTGYIEHLLPAIAKFPRLWNFLVRHKLLPSCGMSDFPQFNYLISLNQLLREKKVARYRNCSQILPSNAVVIYADVFTGLLEVDVLLAFIDVIIKLGFIPYIIYPRVSGKALIVGGFIEQFKKNVVQLDKLLAPLFKQNIPVVGIENTIVLMFRDEVNKFAAKFAESVLTMGEFMSQNSLLLGKLDFKANSEYKLLPHCTEQAIAPNEAILWKSIFSNLGATLDIQNAGCCGMAGNYGYQKEHQQHSQDLFKMNWKAAIQPPSLNNQLEVLATGFSCRSQVKRLANLKIKHPIEILADGCL
ncbi:MAG: FAD-binding oxidoreductase [Burkholderiales bacterium]|nr:FAD-binding oxidoreductase [Burkholderiales bacterium]